MDTTQQSLAEKRRELRRRRILLNPEDRMKKLMGQPTATPTGKYSDISVFLI